MSTPPDGLRVSTERGIVVLRPVDVSKDVPLITEWMNRPHVAEYWKLDWSSARLEEYLVAQQDADISRPCLGLVGGTPVSYWEIYRPMADPLGQAYPAHEDDLGVHVLIGEARLTGMGLGTLLLRAVRDGLFGADSGCGRIVAEPDVRNVASVRAFIKAGFRRWQDIQLDDKTAALMVAEREA